MRLGRLNRLALENRTLKQDAIDAIDSRARRAARRRPRATRLQDVIVFRAEWETIGLGLARLHFRLNSVQLHNAIRPDIALSAAPGPEPVAPAVPAREVTRLLDRVAPGQRALRHRRARADDREARLHARGAVSEALRRPHADSPADRGVRHSVHAARGALLCAALRRRAPRRDLAAVRDGGRPASRRPRHRRAARQPALPRLHPSAGAVLHPARVLGFGPLHRPARRGARDRAVQAAVDPALAGARARATQLAVLRHARRVDRPRRASAQPRAIAFCTRTRARSGGGSSELAGAAQARGELPGRRGVSLVRVGAHGVCGADWTCCARDSHARRPSRSTRSTRTAVGASTSFSRSRTTRSGSRGTGGYLALHQHARPQPAVPDGLARDAAAVGGRAAAGIDSIAELRAIPNNAILHQLGYLVEQLRRARPRDASSRRRRSSPCSTARSASSASCRWR